MTGPSLETDAPTPHQLIKNDMFCHFYDKISFLTRFAHVSNLPAKLFDQYRLRLAAASGTHFELIAMTRRTPIFSNGRKAGNQVMKDQNGFSLIELLIVVVIIGLIAAIAVPNFLSSRRAANEASAVTSLRVLHGAQMSYRNTQGSGNFAAATGDLGTANLIDGELGSGTKSGYEFVITANDTTATEPATFSISAVPSSPSGITQTGVRNFCIRTEGVIWSESDTAQLGTHNTYTECSESNPTMRALQ